MILYRATARLKLAAALALATTIIQGATFDLERIAGWSGPLEGWIQSVRAQGTRAFIQSDGGIGVFDLTDPSQPVLQTSFGGLQSSAGRFTVVGELGHVATIAGFDTFAINKSGRRVSSYINSKWVRYQAYPGTIAIAATPRHVFLGLADGSCEVVDVQDSTRPQLVCNFPSGFGEGGILSIASSADQEPVVIAGASGLAIADGGAFEIRGRLTNLRHIDRVEISGSLAIVSSAGPDARSLRVVDISNPDLPIAQAPFAVGNLSFALAADRIYATINTRVEEFSIASGSAQHIRTLPINRAEIAAGEGFLLLPADDLPRRAVGIHAPTDGRALAHLQSAEPIYPLVIAPHGDFLYRAEHNGSSWQLSILDAREAEPALVGRVPLKVETPRDAAILNSAQRRFVVFRTINERLQFLEVTNPAEPRWIAEWQGADMLDAVAVAGTRIYAAGTIVWDAAGPRKVIWILDASNPEQIAELGREEYGPHVGGLAADGRYLYAAGEGGLRVIDVSDPAHPSQVASARVDDDSGGHIVVHNNRAYMASRSGIRVYDITNPLAPREEQRVARRADSDWFYDIDIAAQQMAIDGNRLFAFHNFGFDWGAAYTLVHMFELGGETPLTYLGTHWGRGGTAYAVANGKVHLGRSAYRVVERPPLSARFLASENANWLEITWPAADDAWRLQALDTTDSPVPSYVPAAALTVENGQATARIEANPATAAKAFRLVRW